MVARKRGRLSRRVVPLGITLILITGRDFFGDLDGGVKGNLELLQAAWADPDIRATVYERQKERLPNMAIWAEGQFGKDQP